MDMGSIIITSNNNENTLGNTSSISPRLIVALETLIIVVFTFFPLLFDLPFRDNLYLSWEGTYRLFIGQLPYKDFGMPIGYGYFIIPLVFFKIFGPFLRSLLYAQVLINLLTILIFRGILREIGVGQVQKFLSVLVFTVSYTFVFFWPWYNNTALFYQMAGIYMIVLIADKKGVKYYSLIAGAALCTFLALFTKQDYGGLAFLFALVLLGYSAYNEKDWKRVPLFLLMYAFVAGIFIYPFLDHGFLYWFNYGQAPHQSRLSSGHFLNEIFGSSGWEKFYLFLIILLAIDSISNWKQFINSRKEVFLLLLSAGMVGEALITKVTSRLPTDTTTYFHGFAFAYIITHLHLKNYTKKLSFLFLAIGLIIIWWSAMYWKYANRMFGLTAQEVKSTPKNEKVFKSEVWKSTPFKVYKNIQLPESTIKGIGRIKNLDVVKAKGNNLTVLNMSELTPLAYELNYAPQKNLPLWYHLNIGMFQKQVDHVSGQIKKNEYDLVLFEVVPGLDNFYPDEIRSNIQKHYQKVDSFMAPRKEGDSHIEVYIKK
jgi:hypothetical protein